MSRNYIKHLRSNEVVGNSPKLPTTDQIEIGEIAVNYAKGKETISIKNSGDEIVSLRLGVGSSLVWE